MHGSEVEARSGDIPVDYNKYQDRPIRGSVAIYMVHTGARRVDMDNSSESPEKASKHSHNSNLVVEDREYLAVINQ